MSSPNIFPPIKKIILNNNNMTASKNSLYIAFSTNYYLLNTILNFLLIITLNNNLRKPKKHIANRPKLNPY